MRHKYLPMATRSRRVIAVLLVSAASFAASASASIFGTWSPAGDVGGPDSPWVAYTVGLSTDDGSDIAAIDVKIGGTFHQRWTSLVEGDPFEATPRGSAQGVDSHLMPIASALIIDVVEDSNLNMSDANMPLFSNTIITKSGTGTNLRGVWGIPGPDQTPTTDFAYLVVPRTADLSQFRFDIDVATHQNGVINTYGLHGCSMFSTGCNFSLTSTFDPAELLPPPVLPPATTPPADPPVVVNPPTPPVTPPADPVVDPQSPLIEDPPIIYVEEPWTPRSPDPNETQPGTGTNLADRILDAWRNGVGYITIPWLTTEIDPTFNLIDWYPTEVVVDYDTPGYLTERTYRDFSANDNVFLTAPIAFTHGTSVAGLVGGAAQPRFFTNASTAASATLLDSSPPAAPEPTAIVLLALGLAALAAFTRRRC